MQDLLPLERAAEAAASAAALLLQRRPERVDHKGAIDLVTEVDLASEARIRELLGASTPDIPVQGEEGGGVVADGCCPPPHTTTTSTPPRPPPPTSPSPIILPLTQNAQAPAPLRPAHAS